MATRRETSTARTTRARKSAGGETHQVADDVVLTTQQGVPVADDQNTLRVGERGPALLEDFHFREKIFHFDHERIPERVVHARGFGAHGYFETYEPLTDLTRADLFQRAGERTPAFVRFSTVAGSKGSFDLARDVRGFAVKFYTQEGNWDLVGNNIPVFFIQDADQVPRPGPRGEAGARPRLPAGPVGPRQLLGLHLADARVDPHAHVGRCRTGPSPARSASWRASASTPSASSTPTGASTFVKFHWKPKQGMQSVVWNEAVKINGADPDFHRRDLWDAIDAGDFPEWELGVQLFDDEFADAFDFDVLDATKLIPEELVPVAPIGRLVLDRTVDNFFAETEQVAFCTQNIVPGIDFTNDPLLQGRNFSYLDTQLKRLGGPNFTHIPVNAPKCPVAHFQQDGHMAMTNPVGRVNYEPNSCTGAERGPREDPDRRLHARSPTGDGGAKRRLRPETFADHYSQARQFYLSQTAGRAGAHRRRLRLRAEQGRGAGDPRAHGRQPAQRRRRPGRGDRRRPRPGRAARPRPAGRRARPRPAAVAGAEHPAPTAPSPFAGRKVGVLVTDGTDGRRSLTALQAAVEGRGGATSS